MKSDLKILVGVTGRAGSGKTAFARLLAEIGEKEEEGGAEVIEADPVAWKLYSRPEIREVLIRTFGIGIFDGKGELDRKNLADVAFADRRKLEALNSIIHPPLLEELDRRICHSKKTVVILDAALLLDWPIAGRCAIKIAVLATKSISLERLIRKGYSSERAQAVLSSQRPENEFKRLCDVIVQNNDTAERLSMKAAYFWKKNIAPLLS